MSHLAQKFSHSITGKKFTLLSIFMLTIFLASCGSVNMADNLMYITTNKKVAPSDDDRIENRNVEICTFLIGGIPLSENPTPLLAYNKLSEGAKYINNLSFASSGFNFGIFGKQCWTANGTAVLP